MLLRKKVFILVVVTIFLLTSVSGSIFAQGNGGNGGNDKDTVVDKPTIKITKFRPKEATKYTWELSGEFSDWAESDSGEFTSNMEFNAERTITEDILQLHVEADTNMDKTKHDLVVELGYMVEKEIEVEEVEEAEEVAVETIDEIAETSTDGKGNGSGDGSDKVDDGDTEVTESFYSLRRFEVGNDEYSLSNGKLEMDWETEDLERDYFDEVTAFRLVVVFDRSRGSDGEVAANKTFELEEHEAYGYTEIEYDLQELIDVDGISIDDYNHPQLVEESIALPSWLVDDQALTLIGDDDKFETQVLVKSSNILDPGGKIVSFTAYEYSESNDNYAIDKNVVLAELEIEVPYIGAEPVYSNNKSLSSISYTIEEAREIAIGDFESHEDGVFEYTVSIPTDDAKYIDEEDPSTLILPTVSATAALVADEVVIIDIDDATNNSRTAVVTVTAEDGNFDIYNINFVYEGNNLATLSDIFFTEDQVTGQEFVLNPSQLSYDYYLATDTAIAASYIDYVVTSDPNANPVITDATIFPGITYITVTAEDNTTELEYKIFFTYLGYDPEDLEEDNGSDNANQGDEDGNGKNKDNEEEETPAVLDSVNTLDTLKIADYSLESFSPELLEYDVELDEGTTELPLVTALAASDLAVVEVIDSETLPGTSFVKVTAEDGTHKMYRINFTVKGMATGEVLQLIEEEVPMAAVDGVMGIWMPPTADGFKLDKSCSKISFWVSQQILTPQLWIMESRDIDTDIEDGTISIDSKDAVVIVTTSELKSSAGKGKHSRSTVENTDGGYYKFNLKGRNCPELETNEDYVLVVMDGDEVVYFGTGTPALLNFTVSEDTKTSVSHRNQDNNILTRSSNSSMNK